ncbi:hypothetical protein NP493_627g01018 [Ridgeia piscesae]|uniref:Uncharacterized protein n=1 Tax=Ridgeia piscesae TaxID=27915 RepID=A0AAD9NNW9_RIDPI|nr:hypothetical protein NP493_627g01018 [Ridgeia piscesae]
MPTQFIRTAANTFEFKATVEYTGIVEGVLRYHPFLYDHETYPSDANDLRAEADPEDDHDYAASDVRPARGRRPIFECYWNGRLIPYSFIDEFDWCSVPKKNKGVPLECYNRVSGVLWTNDKFQVSTNKLTFIDLELRLRDKNTTYGRILGKNDMNKGQQARRLQEYAVVIEKRTDIGREFNAWLKECHERCDKQVKFSQYSGSITRPELVKHRQSPWSVYGLIEWDGKVFKKGTMVRIIKTVPVTYGTIQHFLLYGNHEGDVFATGGDISIIQEPRSLYNEVKTFPLSKLDRTANNTSIMKYIDDEVSKLPNKLVVSWPEGDEVTHGEKRPAGKTIGAIKVEIANRKGELISKLPGAAGGTSRKLLVELKVIWHCT